MAKPKTRPAADPPPAQWPIAQSSVADLVAVRAVASGIADAEQQRRAIRWIIEEAAAVDVGAYRETERDTVFALGRQDVGRALRTVINMPAYVLNEMRRGPEQGVPSEQG